LAHTISLHVFFSSEDDFFQGIGPEIVGTYDRVFISGAGQRGFDLAKLSSAQKAKVVQYPYHDMWKTLANYGGHYDSMAQPFVDKFIEPLLVTGASRISDSGIPR